ncbi:MAG: class I SAM-dependent methyltransferase [Bacteroidales bacterium]|nr:class I SAM-dependent methyltransferase [Bacteroidales bacterium]
MNEKTFWSRYSKLYDIAQHGGREGYRLATNDALREIGGDAVVLELAAGTGLFTQGLAAKVQRLIATDYAEGMVEELKKRLLPENVTVEHADACSLTYEDHSFDVVFIGNCLHIMPRPEQALSEIRRVLKPDGLLIAPTYVREDGWGERFKVGFMKLFGFPDHQRWSAEQFKQFILDNGFTIQQSKLHKGTLPLLYLSAKPQQ